MNMIGFPVISIEQARLVYNELVANGVLCPNNYEDHWGKCGEKTIFFISSNKKLYFGSRNMRINKNLKIIGFNNNINLLIKSILKELKTN